MEGWDPLRVRTLPPPAPSLGLIPMEAEVPSFPALPLLPPHQPPWGPLRAMSLCPFLRVDLHTRVTTGKAPREEAKDAPAHGFAQRVHFWAEKPQNHRFALPPPALSELPWFPTRNTLTPFRQKSPLVAGGGSGSCSASGGPWRVRTTARLCPHFQGRENDAELFPTWEGEFHLQRVVR